MRVSQVACIVLMAPKKKRKSDTLKIDAGKLAAQSRTKTAIVSISKALHDNGHLDHLVTAKQLRKDIASHSLVQTPYGKVVQSMSFGPTSFDYIDPRALMYYLCAISPAFGSIMKEAHDSCYPHPCHIILYNDAAQTGNPFRHDKGRKFEAFYWAISEWPDWALHRSMCWATTVLVRCSIVDRVDGGLQAILRRVINLFRPFADGVMLRCGDVEFVFTAQFHGLLADLIGHAAISSWKGPNAIRCCQDCANVCNSVRGPAPGEIDLTCSDPSQFVRYTDDELFNVIDTMAAAVRAGGVNLQRLQTSLGFDHDPHGLMADVSLRDMYKPSTHHLRDWMHTFVQDGLCNSEMYGIVTRMATLRPPVTLNMLQTFFSMCSLPKKHGKVSLDWIARQRFSHKKRSMASFSGYMLSIIPITYLFLGHYGVDKLLPEEYSSFQMVYYCIAILSSGASNAMQHIEVLASLIENHHELFVKLYSDMVKPKQHHAHHVVDTAKWVGKVLSCFVTERKHKLVKRTAVHVHRHFEHTCLLDVLNAQCAFMAQSEDIFQEEFLQNPQRTVFDDSVCVSMSAVTHVGELRNGDIIYASGDVAGRVVRFVQRNGGPLSLQIDAMKCYNNDSSLRDESDTATAFVEVRDVADACIWFYHARPIIKLNLPPSVLFAH